MQPGASQFLQLSEGSPDAIFISTQGCFSYLNPAALRLFGATSAQQLLGQPVTERILPAERERVLGRMQFLLASGENAPLLDETYLRLDGSSVAVEVFAMPIRHADADSALVVVRDISLRKHTEDALHANQRLLQSFTDNSSALVLVKDRAGRERAEAEVLRLNQSLEQRVSERTRELHLKETELREALLLNENILMSSPVGIAAYRQDGQCVTVNPALAALVGGTREQVLTLNFRQLRSWQESGLQTAAERTLADGTSEELVTRIHTSFGRAIWVHAQFSRFTSQGRPHLLLMLDDITEQKLAAEALAEREREFRTLADNVPDNIARYDCAGRILYVNKTMERTLGQRAEELLGKTALELFSDGRHAALHVAILRVAADGEAEDIEQIVPMPGGVAQYHAIRMVPEWGPDGRPVGVLAVGRDLSKQRMAEDELRLAASVFHNSTEGVLVTDGSGHILSVNPAFTEITGYAAAEALGKNPSMLRSERHGPEFYRAMWSSLSTQGLWQGEIWNRRKSGEAYLEWLTINRIVDASGVAQRYVAVFRDVTELRRKDEHIRHLAFHDALTGLPNRALMQDRLQHALERADRECSRLAISFLDLDRFKSINDTLGHDIGDLLLVEVASRIKGRLRAADTVARLGGDEFVLLVEDVQDFSDCELLARELLQEIARPMDLNGHVVQVSASMGVAFFPEHGTNSLELMKHADMAMYAAKDAGRSTYRFFQP